MADSGTETPETIARHQKISDLLLMQSMKPREIRSPLQGLGQMGEAGIYGVMSGLEDRKEREGVSAQAAAIASLLNGGQSAAPLASPISAPGGEAAPPTVDASIPRGIRNNNPLNIEAGTFTEGQPGFAGSDGRFAKFDTPEGGVGAANKLLDVYQNKHGLNTPAGIVGRWAPAADGNNVSAYAGRVAQALGIGPNDQIPPEMRPKLIAAMGQHENGRPIGDVAAALQARPISNTAPGIPAQPIPTATGTPPVQLAQGGPGAPPTPQNAPVSPETNLAPPVNNKAAIAKMLNDPNPYVRKMGIQLGQGLIQKQLEGDKPTDEMREYNLYRQQGGKDSFFDYKSGLKKAGAQNIAVNNTVNPIVKGVGDRFNDTMDTARAAIPQIQGIHEARKALDQGAITGLGADPKLFLAKAANLFGLDEKSAANTEVARSAIGNSVLAKAKTLGANPSNTDRDYIEKVVGGQIQLEESSIRRLLDMQEKWARDGIKRANAEGKKLLTAQPKELEHIAPLLSVEEPPSYEDFMKANPVAAPQVASGAPVATPKIRKFNPATGKIE